MAFNFLCSFNIYGADVWVEDVVLKQDDVDLGKGIVVLDKMV